MSEKDFDEDKTEDPSEHKLNKAKKDGKRINSKEFNFLLFLCINFYILYLFKEDIFIHFVSFFSNNLKFNFYYFEKNVFDNFYLIIKEKIFIFLLFLLFPIMINILIPFLFGRVSFNIKNINFNLKKINFLKNIKEIFFSNIFIELFKIFFKILCIFSIFIFFIYEEVFKILNINYNNFNNNIFYFFKFFFLSCIVGIISFVPISIVDIILEYRKYYENLKMSKKEVIEEFKNIEGNAYIKNIIKNKRNQNINMSKDLNIYKSDVILIDNNNYYCVALRYDPKIMHAPKILYKNYKDKISYIKKIANENMIPILNDSNLTFFLYKHGKRGKYIPEELYLLMAEIIYWSWNMKKWKLQGGKRPDNPKKFLIN
ncbi:EscU/YscU/HrcU family type III secretion system export apparatus switch protein [Buchnera aphidicola (Ceratoglyphina bambusae)]|uniref:EscU/YscU/HrcU family type III secretion system export apparatus switch protein n=1 Tax=Buchnera aphidicola TaxID=9 RepID=UPI0031B886F4